MIVEGGVNDAGPPLMLTFGPTTCAFAAGPTA